jgi:aryl-alcohol dehydrogenase-like predicted oxidoreductase
MIYNRLDACCLTGMRTDVTETRRAGAAIYGASPLHMGLLGDRFGVYTREKPAWISRKAIQPAKRLKALADKRGMTLSSLAHRFVFSVKELDRIVLGALKMEHLRMALADWKQGALPKDLFCAICESASKS